MSSQASHPGGGDGIAGEEISVQNSTHNRIMEININSGFSFFKTAMDPVCDCV